MGTWTDGDMDRWGHGQMGTWTDGQIGTWTDGYRTKGYVPIIRCSDRDISGHFMYHDIYYSSHHIT